MSKQMLCSFFPGHCSHIFEPFLPRLLALLYPEDVVTACPEQSIDIIIGDSTIRRPFLSVFAILGITIGFGGAYRLQRYWNISVSCTIETLTSSVENAKKESACRFYWTMAFVSFGLMNLSGLFLHCLLPPTENSALEHPFFWMGDTYTTGIFGVALWAASMTEALPKQIQLPSFLGDVTKPKTTEWDTATFVRRGWWIGNGFGIFAIAYFLTFGYQPESSLIPGTLPLESFYAAPSTVYASTGLAFLLFRQFSWQLLGYFLLSYVMFAVALLDPWMCRSFGNTYGDLLTTPTLFFGATDLVFTGIGLWLEKKYILSLPSSEKLKKNV